MKKSDKITHDRIHDNLKAQSSTAVHRMQKKKKKLSITFDNPDHDKHKGLEYHPFTLIFIFPNQDTTKIINKQYIIKNATFICFV